MDILRSEGGGELTPVVVPRSSTCIGFCDMGKVSSEDTLRDIMKTESKIENVP